ncbi:MAG: 2,3-bisphosphoglycerate-dependent phosphoglycerate mutase [Planctomycetota bacterium]
MRRVILLRHGQSEINAVQEQQAVFCGQFDTQLTEHGREQAREAGRLLADPQRFSFSHAVSSVLGRAVETLDLTLQAFPRPPLRLPASPAFNERSLGIFEGRTEADVFRDYPEYRDDPKLKEFRADIQQRAPGGENLTEVSNRAAAALRELLPAVTADLLIVSHCQTIRCLISAVTGRELTQTVNMRIPHARPIILSQIAAAAWELTPDF